MAEPVAPVDTAVADQSPPDSRVAAETLSLGLDILSQDKSLLAMARQMRSLAQLSDSLVREG